MDKDLKKALSDRIYDKRKIAALELEQLVRSDLAEGQRGRIQTIIGELSQDFAYAVRHPNYRNGGLIGLAGVAIALGHAELAHYLEDIVQPILACFGDADARVRYYACESLYNVAKVAKGEILQYFNEIFDVLCKLVADPEDTVRDGAELVDHLIKDIVAEKAATYSFLITRDVPQSRPPYLESPDGTSPAIQTTPEQNAQSFSIKNFIPLLVERIYVGNPSTRTFLIQWVMLLDSIPDLELVSYLPEFLDGLLLFLADTHKEVRTLSKTALSGFLKEIGVISRIKATKNSEEDKSKPVIEPPTSPDASDPLNGEWRTTQAPSQELAPIQTMVRSRTQSPAPAKIHIHKDEAPRPLQEETTQSAETTIEEDTYIIGQDIHIDLAKIMTILLDRMDPSHDEMRLVILEWLEGLLEISPKDVISKLPALVEALLPALSDSFAEIRVAGQRLSDHILSYLGSHHDELKIDGPGAITALQAQFSNEEKVTRLAALHWLAVLERAGLIPTIGSEPGTMSVILGPLSDPSDDVVAKDLELIEQILRDSPEAQFGEFVQQLFNMLRTEEGLLAARGRSIFSQLCQRLEPERTFRTVAAKLRATIADGDPGTYEFAELVVQNLTTILITAPELHPIRARLKQLDTQHGAALFTILFKSWSISSVSALALCLLAEAYENAYAVLQILASLDVTVSTLVQIDRLVQLIEGPSLASMRLHLLEPARYPYLYRTLYGLLMVLPQTAAFKTLQTRLSSVTPIGMLPAPQSSQQQPPPPAQPFARPIVQWSDLLESFRKMHTS